MHPYEAYIVEVCKGNMQNEWEKNQPYIGGNAKRERYHRKER